MIKKFILAGLLLFSGVKVHAFTEIFYLQDSTGTVQPGTPFFSSGTITNFTASSITAPSLITTSMTVTDLTVLSTTTIRGNVGIVGAINQPLTVTSSMTVTNAAFLGSAGQSVQIASTTILQGATFYANSSVVLSSYVVFSPTTMGIKGTTTNDNADIGLYGEYKSSTSLALATNFPASGTFGDLVSMSLTAGDWDITGVINCTLNGSTIQAWLVGISLTGGNNGATLNAGDSRSDGAIPTTTYDVTNTVSVDRFQLTTTTTVFLKFLATYSVGNPKATGRLSARRVR